MTNKETKIELPEELPEGLPIPEDDGAADHLPGKQLPSVALKSTAGASWISPPPRRDRGVLLPADGPTGQRDAAGPGRDPRR